MSKRLISGNNNPDKVAVKKVGSSLKLTSKMKRTLLALKSKKNVFHPNLEFYHVKKSATSCKMFCLCIYALTRPIPPNKPIQLFLGLFSFLWPIFLLKLFSSL